jgi:predicted Zn finger-like uncharacterized protein
MATQIECPHCHQTYDLTAEQAPQYAGQTITCTRCQKPFTVPANLGGAAAPQRTMAPTYVEPAAQQTTPAYPGQQSTQYAMQPGIAAGPRQTNGFAIASLICGILGCTGIGGILAIVFGILGIQKTKDPRYGGKGMAIAGIIIGSLGLVAPCMISILLPSLNRARETANRVKCASNMRSIGQAMIIYATSNRGYLPPDLAMVVPVGVKMDQFVCPSASDTPASNAAGLSTPGHLSYVYVYQGKPMSLRKLGPGSRAAGFWAACSVRTR